MRIKSYLKRFLAAVGLWYPLNLLRAVPAIFRWLRAGSRDVAPHPVKLMVLRSYLKRFSLTGFVETGTYLGDTLGYIAKTGIQCTSVELSVPLYDAACRRFRRYRNVRLVQGDSGARLPELLKEISAPTLFWLDGHFSCGITARADLQTPISAELQAILNHSLKSHVILIDDARCFLGSDDYPYLDELLCAVRENGYYNVEISADIIRLIPRSS